MRVAVGDRPMSGYRVLEWRLTAGLVAWLLALAAVGWAVTVRQATGMHGMALGLGQVGGRMPADMSWLVFLGMWLGMMAAMMLPTVGPVVLMHHDVTRRRGDGLLSTVAFVGGYLLAWTAAGLVPLVVYLWFRGLSSDAAGSRWLTVAGGVTLVVAGAYQFTAWKAACARACRSPLSFLMTHDFGRGWRGALRAGAGQGLWCLGCCWALMAVLVVVGLMNLVWMVAISLVFLAEKHWTRALQMAKVIGVGLVVLGTVAVIDGDVLATVSDAGGQRVEMHSGGNMGGQAPAGTGGTMPATDMEVGR